MLYIASALKPTSVIDSKLIPNFTGSGGDTLLVAKPDRIEVWDVQPTGLVQKGEIAVWGNVVCLEPVDVKGARPHVLVLLAPPSARLLLLTYNPSTTALIVTSSLPLLPPTPSLRQAEFFSSVIAHESMALVSLWVGVLSCIEMDVEKEKGGGRRRSSAAHQQVEVQGDKKLVFKDSFNINIREHNLLHLAFLPHALPSGPLLTFLYLSPTQALQLQTRSVSLATHGLTDISRPIDVVSPLSTDSADAEADYNDLPFSCPAARRVLPIPTPDGPERMALVIGDEFSVLYSISLAAPTSPKARRLSSASGPASSPRASAVKRSPQNEVTSGVGKRRKNSSSKMGDERWEMKPLWRIRQGFGTILAAAVLRSDAHGASVLLGDDCGRLTAIAWDITKGDGELGVGFGQINVSRVEIGLGSPPSSLTHLAGPHVFLGSSAGDSQVLRLSLPAQSPNRLNTSPGKSRPIPARKGKGRARNQEDSGWAVDVDEMDGRVEVLERWMNLAPVKDFTVVNDDSGAMSHLVVASGASTSNSLRIIRSGVGMEEITSIQGVSGVERMWTLCPGGAANNLLLATLMGTILLQLEPVIQEIQICSQLTSARVLAASMAGGDLLVAVSEIEVTVWSDVVNGNKVASLPVAAGQEITCASISGRFIVVAKRGGEVAVISLSGTSLTHEISIVPPAEVASVSVYSSDVLALPVVVVGTWTNRILIYAIPTSPVTAVTPSLNLPLAAYASSLQLKSSVLGATGNCQLLAGLSDGSLVVYDLAVDNDGGVQVTDKKVSSLGTRPLDLHQISGWEGDERIVAVGLSERMSVVFEAKERVDFSSVSRKDVTAAASLSSSQGQSLILASPSGLTISKVNSLKRLSVQTMDLQEKSVTRLAYLPAGRILAAGCINRRMDSVTGEILQHASLELRDPTTLQILGSMPLLQREIITALQPVQLLGRPYLAVGTAVFSSDPDYEDAVLDNDYRVTAKEGRVLLINPLNDRNREWELVVWSLLKLVGPVHDLKVIHGFLAIAAASTVSIHRLTPGPVASLVEVSTFSSTFVAQHLTVTPRSQAHPEDRLVVGDGMRSVFVLEVDEGSGKIYDDQRDMATHCVLGMEAIRDETEGVVIADGHANLLTFRFKSQIEPAASFGLHEDIVRFAPGSFAPPSSAPDVITPSLLFATADGRLGMIGELTPAAAKVMGDLQRNMDKYTKGPGGAEWRVWRRGGTELIKRETAGFIDGDFIQRYLDADGMPADEAKKARLGSSTHEQVQKMEKNGNVTAAERSDIVRMLEAAAGLH